MTVRGWMVVLCGIVCALILASCSKNNDDHDGDHHDHRMSCAEFQQFSASGLRYAQEGGGLVAYNGQGQRLALSPEDTQPGGLMSRCMGTMAQGGFYPQPGMQPGYFPGQMQPMGPPPQMMPPPGFFQGPPQQQLPPPGYYQQGPPQQQLGPQQLQPQDTPPTEGQEPQQQPPPQGQQPSWMR